MRHDPRGGSISALVLYLAGGTVTVMSMTLLIGPTETTFGPGLVGTGLGLAIVALGRVVAVLTEIRDELRANRRSS